MTQSTLGCQVRIGSIRGSDDAYLACLELADADSDELDASLPEISDQFTGRTRHQIGEEDIFQALRISFDRWLALRDVPSPPP